VANKRKMANNKTTSGGISLAGAVFIVFLILKLAGIGTVATWSWWWVCSPLWIPLAIVLGVFLIIGLIALLMKS
jgi:hypothetical protein